MPGRGAFAPRCGAEAPRYFYPEFPRDVTMPGNSISKKSSAVKYLSFSSPLIRVRIELTYMSARNCRNSRPSIAGALWIRKPFHVKVVFKVIKAVLHHILIPVCRQGLFGAEQWRTA